MVKTSGKTKVATMLRHLAILLTSITAACGNSSTQADDPSESANLEMPIAEEPPSGPTIATAPSAVPPQPPLPDHNFDERRGWTYYYIAAVSEEDKKRGRAVGNVSGFQYLGKNASGEHILASIGPNGLVSYRAKCASPCRIIDTDDGDKIAYSTSSIIGGAFEDAFRGKLRIADWAKDEVVKPSLAKVPRAIVPPAVAEPTPEIELNDTRSNVTETSLEAKPKSVPD